MFSNMNSHHLQPRPAATSTESTQHSSVGLTKKDSDGAYDLEKRYQMALQEGLCLYVYSFTAYADPKDL